MCRGFDDGLSAHCKVHFERLDAHSFATLIHGDLHPGNLRLSAGRLIFVDWGYAVRSLNLSDLDYVQSVELAGEAQWWQINPPQAQAVLAAYFEASDLSTPQILALHRSVMVWNQLSSRFNALQHGDLSAAALCVNNLECLIGKEG